MQQTTTPTPTIPALNSRVHIDIDGVKVGQIVTLPETLKQLCIGCGGPMTKGQRVTDTIKGCCHAKGGKKASWMDKQKFLNCLDRVVCHVRDEAAGLPSNTKMNQVD